jgi:hypothetical protein
VLYKLMWWYDKELQRYCRIWWLIFLWLATIKK